MVPLIRVIQLGIYIDHFVVDVVDSSHLDLTFVTFCLLSVVHKQ